MVRPVLRQAQDDRGGDKLRMVGGGMIGGGLAGMVRPVLRQAQDDREGDKLRMIGGDNIGMVGGGMIGVKEGFLWLIGGGLRTL